MKQTKQLLLSTLGPWDLELIARVMNTDTSPRGDKLRELFGRYRSYGRNLKLMLRDDVGLDRKLWNLWTVRYVATPSGGATFDLSPASVYLADYTAETWAEYQALQLFSRLPLNTKPSRLDGPCIECGKYFVRHRDWNAKNGRIFCSKKCGHTWTAKNSAKTNRQNENDKKLERALSVAPSYDPKRSGASFRDFVAKTAKLTRTWVTQAIKAGKLREPTQRRKA